MELITAAAAAAVLPAHRYVVPVVCRMASLDQVAGNKEILGWLLRLVQGDEAGMRTAVEVSARILAGNTRPDGQVVPVGSAAGDPLMMLACDAIQMTVRGDAENAWAQLKQQHPARRAAVLSLLVNFLNYQFAGLNPVALAADEWTSR